MNINGDLRNNKVLLEAIPRNTRDLGFNLTADILEGDQGKFPVCFYLTPVIKQREGGLFLVSAYHHDISADVEAPELVKAYVAALTMFAKNSDSLFERSAALEMISFYDKTCFGEPMYRANTSDMPIGTRDEISRENIADLKECLADPSLNERLVERWSGFSKDITQLIESDATPILHSSTARCFTTGDKRSIIPAPAVFQNL